MSNNKPPGLLMFTHTEIHKCNDIIPPTHEVRMKIARMKTQEKYEKIMSNAF